MRTRRTLAQAVFALVLLALARSGAEATPLPRCAIRVEVRLPSPPADELAPALAAWYARVVSASPLDLALAGVDASLVGAVTPTATGAALSLTVAGPAAQVDALRATAASVAAALGSSTARGSDDATVFRPPTVDETSLDAARAALTATQHRHAGDLDGEMASARLMLLIDSAQAEVFDGCPGAATTGPARATTAARLVQTSDTLRMRAPMSDVATPPRLHIVAALSGNTRLGTDAEAMTAIAVAYLSHPGGSHQRALNSPGVRATGATARAFPEAGLLVLSIDLDHGADADESLRAARRAIAATHAGLNELRGAALRTGADPSLAQRVAPFVDALFAPDATTWVIVPPRHAPEHFVEFVPDPATHDRFIAASVELRCPAPGDTRRPEVRLRERFDLTPEAWRALARSMASDQAGQASLEREIDDRCGELARLRRLVTPRIFQRFYRTYRCELAPLSGTDAEWTARQTLMRSLGFDTALFRPMIEMAPGDPRLEAIMVATDAQCPVSQVPETSR